MKRGAVFGLLLCCLFALSSSECPNGCSKHGVCGRFDMCTCFKNWMGNDCSQMICPFNRAHVDTQKGDLDMDNAITNTLTVQNSQMYPYGTYENFPHNQADEAHFYMECSNKGVCQRDKGVCKCYTGYEGSACQRVSCPNTCSGHGVCQPIKYLADTAGGTVYGNGLDVGNAAYTLWDAYVSQGCKCDPGYYAADCSMMRCKYGVDPLYLSQGNPLFETVQFRIIGSGAGTLGGYVTVRFYDKFGEAYITPRISVSDNDVTNAANFQAAFLSLPNGVVPFVSCDVAGSSTFAFVPLPASTYGTHVVCQFVGNPGKLRTAVLHDVSGLTGLASAPNAFVLPTTQSGEDYDMCPLLSSAAVTTTNNSTAAVLSAADASIPTTLTLFKINTQYVLGTLSGTALTLMVPWAMPSITAPGIPLFYSKVQTADTSATGAVAVGSTTVTTSSDLRNFLPRGMTVFIENVLFTVVSCTSTTLTLNKPFPGLASTGTAATASKIFAINRNLMPADPSSLPQDQFQYVSECSGRGLCDTTSGLCKCFKGYAGDNCNMQDANLV